VLCRAVNRDWHVCVFASRPNVTRRTEAHGDVTDRGVGLRVAGTGLKAHVDQFDVSAERAHR
jgi:hypothetical protein